MLTPLDEVVFTQLVPPDHYLRRHKAAVDFTPLLQQHYGWSDIGVLQQGQVNVALRFFLDWSLTTTPPDASLLPVCRQRLRKAPLGAAQTRLVAHAGTVSAQGFHLE